MVRTRSLKKNHQFRLVYHKGKSLANRYLVLYVYHNGLPHNRLGISVSKKVGNSVTRSRVTRLIKENYRLHETNIDCGYDFVLIARVSMKEASFDATQKAFVHLCKKHGLWLPGQSTSPNQIASPGQEPV